MKLGFPRLIAALALLLAWLFPHGAWASRLYSEGKGSISSADSARLEAATKAFESRAEVAALDAMLEIMGPDVIERQIGNWGLGFGDASKHAAYQVLNRFHSIELLRQTLEQGSDLAAYWALGRLERQWHTSTDGKGPLNHQLEAARGWVDRIAIKSIAPAVIQAEQTRSAKTRAYALQMISAMEMLPDVGAFARAQLDDPDELVVAVAIGWVDAETPPGRAIVWHKLATSKNDEITSAGVGKLRDALKGGMSPDQAALLERLLRHPNYRIREDLTRSLCDLATPARPELVALLLRLTEDKEHTVRQSAVRSLRNAKTPEVRERLLELLAERGPEHCRPQAIEVLGALGKENVEAIIGAADDPESYVRWWVCMTLRHLPTDESIATLQRLTEDPDGKVNQTAREQLDWAYKERALRAERAAQ